MRIQLQQIGDDGLVLGAHGEKINIHLAMVAAVNRSSPAVFGIGTQASNSIQSISSIRRTISASCSCVCTRPWNAARLAP